MKNRIQKRSYKERSQLSSRQHLGLLEKKKDYVLRAKDYHFKQKRLTALKEKAAFRNPDEFYFKMINTKTKNGVHVEQRSEKYDHDMLKLLKTQDQGYVNYQRSVNMKKIERLKDSLHFIAGAGSDAKAGGEDNGSDMGDEEEYGDVFPAHDKDFLGLDEESSTTAASSKLSYSSSATHTIFVDDDEQAKSFNPASHFDTIPELVSYKFNRPRIAALESGEVGGTMDQTMAKKIQKEREKTYRELASRLDRDDKLLTMQREMDLQKTLMGKGTKRKVGTDKRGLPIYKWKAERKR